MPIRVRCGKCDKPLKIAEELAGKRIHCPGCGSVLSVPKAADSVDGPSTEKSALPNSSSTADVPDEWLFDNERLHSATAQTGAMRAAEPDEYRVSQEPAAPAESSQLLPRRSKKSKSTFAAVGGEEVLVAAREGLRRIAEARDPSARSPASWRDHLFWVLLVAIAPLAISMVWQERPVAERWEETRQRLSDNAAQEQHVIDAPPAAMSESDFFASLPERRIAGAHLTRDSWMHWGYATLSATLFLALLAQSFPNTAAGPRHLICAGILTGTVGIILLLAFQWIAVMSLRVGYIRGRGIAVLLFYIVKFIGFSYRSALNPENGFLLSFMGFTYGVGLCEEMCKALPIALFLRAKPHAGWRAACLVGLASGVGFGVSEGIMYSSDSYNGIAVGMTYLVRFASCVALHAMWAGAVALVMNRNQDYLEGFGWDEVWKIILQYLLIAMVLHGLYDTLLKREYEFWALAVAAASFAWLARLVRRERADE